MDPKTFESISRIGIIAVMITFVFHVYNLESLLNLLVARKAMEKYLKRRARNTLFLSDFLKIHGVNYQDSQFLNLKRNVFYSAYLIGALLLSFFLAFCFMTVL